MIWHISVKKSHFRDPLNKKGKTCSARRDGSLKLLYWYFWWKKVQCLEGCPKRSFLIKWKCLKNSFMRYKWTKEVSLKVWQPFLTQKILFWGPHLRSKSLLYAPLNLSHRDASFKHLYDDMWLLFWTKRGKIGRNSKLLL